MRSWSIREERPADAGDVQAVNEAAFGRPDEGLLVARLHDVGAIILSLVAVVGDGRVAGHILFSPLTIHPADGQIVPAVALGPMAVLPQRQNEGIGGALIRDGLRRCAAAGHTAVIVLGHPGYYPRFGFRPASAWGITNTFGISGPAFMALELQPGALQGAAGVAHYHTAFDEVT